MSTEVRHSPQRRRMKGTPSRRAFLSVAASATAGGLGWSLETRAQPGSPVRLARYVADVNGDGFLTGADEQIVRAALFRRRGFNVSPNEGWNFRADVFGRGAIDSDAVNAVAQTVADPGVASTLSDRRPVTVCWHYGWYDTPQRPRELQTVRFLGGDYVSSDPEIEGTFNDLKNESGVSVDALSWMPFRVRPSMEQNYRTGYLQAHNSATRMAALLYESIISLGADGSRIDFSAHRMRALLNADFEQMGRFFAEIRDRTPVRPFLLDGRPVVFLFGSHTWVGETAGALDGQLMTDTVADARSSFRRAYGTFPYLVGDEFWNLSHSRADDLVRNQHVTRFDGVFAYYHALIKQGSGTVPLDQYYSDSQLRFSDQGYRRLDPLRNVYTGKQILAIPSLASGFAKPGWPTLTVRRSQFADFMKFQKALHWEQYLQRSWSGALGTAALPAPVFTVGSWNEEFEGHAVFPFSFNHAVPEVIQRGFDLAMALREVFGWNHYAERDP